MSEPTPPQPPAPPPPAANQEFKAAMLLLVMLLLVCGSIAYVLYARGAFEATQQLVLVADDSEGVVVGMDLTFAGFPIGRVRRIELADDGNARILVDVPRKDAHWLRVSSVFTLARGLVGNTNIRAFSGMLNDPPLPDGAVRRVLSGDATAEIPRLVTAVKEMVENISTLTAKESPLGMSLTRVQTLTEKLNGPHGVLGVLLGNEADTQKMLATLDHSNALLSRLEAMLAKADTQVFGQGGVMNETQATIKQMNALLGEARNSLKKVDAVLQDAQAVGSNVREASTDLGALRAEVETNLRKVEGMLNEINRRWPFARDTELKLP
jgi:phospholipid/cholesterol/gamma-HCH transport system substrate-binding protein